VSATITTADGRPQIMDATYVAGCDGGRSGVRQMNGIGFPGAPYEHSFFVADTEATGPMVPDELNVQLWRTGFHLYFPMRGKDRWRVIGILPDDLEKKGDVTFEDLAPSLVRESRGALEFTKCLWFSTYRIHHRAPSVSAIAAASSRHARTCTARWQGMNTGLQDAYNSGSSRSSYQPGR
jgi:2-polyprenyl-6-methoxyphenol hydroxylase-like FAD-dependent oxidoreductase